MTQEIVEQKEQNTELTTIEDDLLSVDDDGREDGVMIARVMLLQSNSSPVQEEGERLGTFYHKEAKENLGDETQMIAIKLFTGATLLRQGEGLVCRSNDGITNMFGQKCAECPFNAYYGGEWDGNKGPECQKTIDIFGLFGEKYIPGIITFRSKSYREGKTIRKVFRFNKGRPKIKLVSAKEKNDKGTYFVPKLVGKTLGLTAEERDLFLNWKTKLAEVAEHLNEDGMED